MESRIQFAKKNVLFSTSGNIINILLGFIVRTIFISTLGVKYLGVNGLYSNLLSVLSLAELGIGTAMNFSLYKPIAKNDFEKIKVLMQIYKTAYRIIALIVLLLGLSLLPFINLIIKDPGSLSINELRIYFLIFLVNTVSTYLVSYKYSLLNGEQKNYIQTNIQVITQIIIVVCQLIVLIKFENYLLYLLVFGFINLLQKIIVNNYLNKLYPYLLEKDFIKLSDKEVKTIRKNIFSLFIHKIGDISLHQTDNIIISAFVSLSAVGLLSNYKLILISLIGLVDVIFYSVISGFGNLIAVENKEKQYEVFKAYRFLSFWIYGFITISLFILITPFIRIWIGESMVLSENIIFLYIMNYYFKAHRIALNNFKNAAGIFNADKFIAIFQSIFNLIISIILVKHIGISGVFIGTILSGLISNLTKPFIIYELAFQKKAREYYIDSIKYLFIFTVATSILYLLKQAIYVEFSITNFCFLLLLVILITNSVFYVFLHKRPEFGYYSTVIKNMIKV